MSYQALGPGRIYVGDPTTADGMVSLGDHENVSFSPNFSVVFSNTANTGDLPLPESLRARPAAPSFSVELYDQSIKNLQALLAGQVETVTSGTDPDIIEAMVARADTKTLEPFTTCFIPEAEVDQGVAAPHAIWIPSSFVQNVGELFSYGRLSEGENNNPFSAEITATRPAESLSTDATMIYGDPSAEGLSWMSPAGSAA